MIDWSIERLASRLKGTAQRQSGFAAKTIADVLKLRFDLAERFPGLPPPRAHDLDRCRKAVYVIAAAHDANVDLLTPAQWMRRRAGKHCFESREFFEQPPRPARWVRSKWKVSMVWIGPSSL